MEAPKRNLRARKPLSDCTNTVLSSQSSASNFSSVIKPRRRVIKSAVKDAVNNEKKGESSFTSASASLNLQASNPSSDCLPTEPNPSSDCLPTEPNSSSDCLPTEPNASSDCLPTEPNASSDCLPTEPSSSSLPAEASTPTRRADLPSSSGTDRVSEPQSFYSRRHPTNKRKSTEIAFTPFIFATASKIHTMGEKRDGYSSPSKARTVPCKKQNMYSDLSPRNVMLSFCRGNVEQYMEKMSPRLSFHGNLLRSRKHIFQK
ncbi:uncharacterized protein LOC111006488 isoform X2 [Momordica charantia]|uniref:Uncharacterized protein LOC111006488 isoform X2 n=1 Tax=Momordica charantia TaxID=3673 RepID=A0A6J1BXZ7_MOMCH|nr:uncharacterized protein LOC111006488 isoform X2 [Momordica charantia]